MIPHLTNLSIPEDSKPEISYIVLLPMIFRLVFNKLSMLLLPRGSLLPPISILKLMLSEVTDARCILESQHQYIYPSTDVHELQHIPSSTVAA